MVCTHKSNNLLPSAIEKTKPNATNYKGIYVEDKADQKHYVSPTTGAHFEFDNMCERLTLVGSRRIKYLQNLARQDEILAKFTVNPV
jgi:hypothetical protein